jgi:hypothetical protein
MFLAEMIMVICRWRGVIGCRRWGAGIGIVIGGAVSMGRASTRLMMVDIILGRRCRGGLMDRRIIDDGGSCKKRKGKAKRYKEIKIHVLHVTRPTNY